MQTLPRSSRSTEAAPSLAPGMRAALRPVHTERIASMLGQAWQWLATKRQAQLDGRRMRVLETVQLGDKRFVTLLAVDGARFLIGGATGHVALLTRLDAEGAASAQEHAAQLADLEEQA